MYKKYLLGIRKFWKASNSFNKYLGKLNIKFSAGQFLSGIFYGRMDVRICLRITNPDGGILGANRQVFTPLHSNVSNPLVWYQNKNMFTNYKPRRERLRVPSGTYETSISYVLLHCIRRVRIAFERFEPGFDAYQILCPRISYLDIWFE